MEVIIYLPIFFIKKTNISSDFTVSDFISDHRVLHQPSLQSIRIHPVQIQIAIRATRGIKVDKLAGYLDKFGMDQWCVDVDIMIEQYDFI